MAFTKPSLRNLTMGFGNIPDKQNEYLQTLGKPHVDSFNNFLNVGLSLLETTIDPVRFALPNDDRVTIRLHNLRIAHPGTVTGSIINGSQKIYPSECRQRGGTYSGKLWGKVICSVNGEDQVPIEKDFGNIPIMVKSDRCHLAKLSPKELIKRHEHGDEWGGYFIMKGHERLVRMLISTRRNYPCTVQRSTWKQRGQAFSDKGVFIKCVTTDHTSTNNVLHFVTDGTVRLMFSYNRNMFYVPLCLILKCLLNVSDKFIYDKLLMGREHDLYYKSCVVNMLRLVYKEKICTHEVARRYIGNMFRVRLINEPPWLTDDEICEKLLKNTLLIHLNKNEDKFNLLIFMTQKLFSFVQDKCCVEGVDAVMFQEVLLGGHLYQQVLKDRLQSWLINCKLNILKKVSSSKLATSLNISDFASCCKRSGTIESSIGNFVSTGNVKSQSKLGLLMQEKGLTIVVENINRMRYMSHFRSVHRGSFFQQMRTTESRQLLPDAWGFICPVHTPDGSPCGLLNHLAKYTEITDVPDQKLLNNVPVVLSRLGMIPVHNSSTICRNIKFYTVLLDGQVIGYFPIDITEYVVTQLRVMKVEGVEVPKTMEIVLVPMKEVAGQFPGLYLFTGPARMVRPVMNLSVNKIELVGSFEQVYMDICIKSDEFYTGVTTHQELSETAFLSNLACLIPMPDCNQSPRNMYQCQMGKQTMGTCCHTWNIQAETKLYRLQTPASPLFRPSHYDQISLDDFAMGTNAVVAVISYTGYDMEDAMIINKSSYERGFAHGSILKSEMFELVAAGSKFERDPNKPELERDLDVDGLPYVGSVLDDGSPVCCFYDQSESKYVTKYHHGKELVYVDNVRMCSGVESETSRAFVTFRLPRNPSVGDKFASRAGQKGICSQLWPAEDLPFTGSGLVPDIVFNPHGFPSRMTIAMMIELMAGKAGAVHGAVYDATPFEFDEDNTAIDHFGRLLEAGGYNYYGTEKMYSGVDGREMEAAIFFGVVYYQRLRHMVLDKWQVRSTGPIDILTQQPIKGRRRGGGVRFGEMERDSLISHGASFLLRDRLFNCSDKYKSSICTKCNSLLSPTLSKMKSSGAKRELCRLCPDGGLVQPVEIPYILRYMLVQLASVNINLKFFTKNKLEEIMAN